MHKSHFKCLVATCGHWLLCWMREIQNIPVILGNSIGQCCSRQRRVQWNSLALRYISLKHCNDVSQLRNWPMSGSIRIKHYIFPAPWSFPLTNIRRALIFFREVIIFPSKNVWLPRLLLTEDIPLINEIQEKISWARFLGKLRSSEENQMDTASMCPSLFALFSPLFPSREGRHTGGFLSVTIKVPLEGQKWRRKVCGTCLIHLCCDDPQIYFCQLPTVLNSALTNSEKRSVTSDAIWTQSHRDTS